MPIRRHLPDQNSFEPHEIAAMSRALEEVCAALDISAGDTRGREIIATRIIDLARNGVTDAATLRDRLLMESRALA